jgi:hypothetical protein
LLAAWGSGRYDSAGQFTALVYSKHFGAADPTGTAQIVPWAKRQMAYLLGENPLNLSYMMGFTHHYAKAPHHPAGHASTSGEPDVPQENKHRGGSEYGQPTSIQGPLPCTQNTSTFYYEMGFEGYKFWGEMVKLKAPRTFILDIGVGYGPGCAWTPANDWSYDALSTGDPQLSPHVPVYSGGQLVWGEEPVCNQEAKRPVIPETVY